MMTAALFIAAVLALALSAFCSGSESGLLSVSRGRLLHMAREGGRRAGIIHAAVNDIQLAMTTILVGNNLANVMFSSVLAALSERLLPGSALAHAVWGTVVAVIMLVFGEFMPKLFLSARPLRRLLMLAPAWKVFYRVFRPFGFCMYSAVNRLLPRREQRVKVTPETVLQILQDRKDGVKLSELECALIGRIMVLRAKGAKVTPESLLEAVD
jgi:CBS domain containing-hemolysin-like protein